MFVHVFSALKGSFLSHNLFYSPSQIRIRIILIFLVRNLFPLLVLYISFSPPHPRLYFSSFFYFSPSFSTSCILSYSPICHAPALINHLPPSFLLILIHINTLFIFLLLLFICFFYYLLILSSPFYPSVNS